MTPSNLIVETNATKQGISEQSPSQMRFSVLQMHLFARETSLDLVREDVEDLLKTDGIEVECYSPSIHLELEKGSSVNRDESRMIDVDAEVVESFNSLSVEIFPSPIRFSFIPGVRQGLAEALRERARLLLSMAERVLADQDFEEIPEITKDDLLSDGEAIRDLYRKSDDSEDSVGDTPKRYEVIDCGRVVFSTPCLGIAKSFCSGANLPETSIRAIDVEASAKSA